MCNTYTLEVSPKFVKVTSLKQIRTDREEESKFVYIQNAGELVASVLPLHLRESVKKQNGNSTVGEGKWKENGKRMFGLRLRSVLQQEAFQGHMDRMKERRRRDELEGTYPHVKQ